MNNRIERIKKHFRDNKKTYIVTGISVVITAATTYLLTRNNVKVTRIINNVTPVFNNTTKIAPVLNNSSSVNFGGYAHKIIKCAETGEVWETVKEAAASSGVSLVEMSRHINGHRDHLNGKTYSIIGVGTH